MDEKDIRSLPTDKLIEFKAMLQDRGDKYMANENDNRIAKLEASMATLIARFKAQEEYAEEQEKLKAEEEQKLRAEEEEKVRMQAEEKPEEEEEEEEKKMKAEEEAKKVPYSEVAEEEKVKKLEKQVAQLASIMQKYFKADDGAITPETPEDEPAMTVHKIPKVSNEPVKSDKPKEGAKSPFDTPAQHPGKLKAAGARQSQAFTGAQEQSFATNQERLAAVEQKAVEEIFGFAASEGVAPMHADYRIKTLKA